MYTNIAGHISSKGAMSKWNLRQKYDSLFAIQICTGETWTRMVNTSWLQQYSNIMHTYPHMRIITPDKYARLVAMDHDNTLIIYI